MLISLELLLALECVKRNNCKNEIAPFPGFFSQLNTIWIGGAHLHEVMIVVTKPAKLLVRSIHWDYSSHQPIQDTDWERQATVFLLQVLTTIEMSSKFCQHRRFDRSSLLDYVDSTCAVYINLCKNSFT